MLFQYNELLFSERLLRAFTSAQVSLLGKQGLVKGRDFLLLRPKRYDTRRHDVMCSSLSMDVTYALIGKVRSISRRTVRKNLTVFSAHLMTKNDRIPLVWFNQKYILEKLKHDPFVVVYGKRDVNHFDVVFQVSSFEICSSYKAAGDGQLVPFYPDIKGISNKGLVFLIQTLLNDGGIQDMLPDSIRSSEGLIGSLDALHSFHFPSNQGVLNQALKRLAFDELFMYMYPRRDRHTTVTGLKTSVLINPMDPLVQQYLDALPYQLTNAQARVWGNVSEDFDNSRTVFRLIQGDVGSGKTDIAILALLAAVGSGYQSAMLVPTEILAEQHYLKLMDRCQPLGVPIYLIKGKQRKKERDNVIDALRSDMPLIVVGTHALVQDAVSFSNLGLVVIDEQHRFGVFQRQVLLEKINPCAALFIYVGNPHSSDLNANSLWRFGS